MRVCARDYRQTFATFMASRKTISPRFYKNILVSFAEVRQYFAAAVNSLTLKHSLGDNEVGGFQK